ncbi:hypothetical protein CBI33_22750 [Rhodococcus erythropolis]|nr:hypothetical protein CBI33_22750 [Rhodococcus erythropolis]
MATIMPTAEVGTLVALPSVLFGVFFEAATRQPVRRSSIPSMLGTNSIRIIVCYYWYGVAD